MADYRRTSDYAERARQQRAKLQLPMFPTTTIGSFPQTQDVRRARAQHKRGDLSDADYDAFLKQQIDEAIAMQEEIGFDMLVHGEFERNDMVEYFGEQLAGFAFTKFGWVQSYGSRYVKPPIIYGDVSRPEPMTVKWSQYAQSRTAKPMKGMLTGPVTMLQWAFVRDDQPRSETVKQVALAIRDEIVDLEAAGLAAIQSTRRLSAKACRCAGPTGTNISIGPRPRSGSRPAACATIPRCTPICATRSSTTSSSRSPQWTPTASPSKPPVPQMELLDAFGEFAYPNEIGPGVYDIHSPRVPSTDEMVALLEKAVAVLPAEKLWVNPDCGLKTRGWAEVKPALENMVAAARRVRARYAEAA